MNLIKVAAAALNQTPLDWERNKRNMLQAIETARAEGVSLLCLPELCITGYGCEDAFHSPGLLETAGEILAEIAPATRGMVVSVGLPVLVEHGIFNTACLIADGRILGFVGKRFLAGDGIHYEPRWFKPWPQGVQGRLTLKGKEYPVGDLYFDVGGVKVGFEICEDAWVARRPGAELALKGVDLILNPSASHFAFGKMEVRKRFVQEGSRAFGAVYLYANLSGCEAGRILYDGGALLASGGRLIAVGDRFSFKDVLVTSAVVDLAQTRMGHARTASFQPDLKKEDGSSCIRAEFEWPAATLSTSKPSPAAWENSSDIKKEEFTRAVTLGLFDYLRKTRAQGFVVSLSGGADSSAVACLVALMAERGVADLGREGFAQAFSHIESVRRAQDARQAVRALLTTVYQSTRHSSRTTRSAASEVADSLGARHLEMDVDLLVEQYVEIVSHKIGHQFTWETDDMALQNIQARVRAPGVWLVANERNAILLTTSNRSEAAVGYATMDGDTCGGLCPIGGIDKAFLREWLIWMEREGPQGLHPFPALKAVNAQQPTAELRPSEQGQTDEEDLMPYQLLDAIERLAIRDKKTPLEVFLSIRAEFPGRYPDQALGGWVERFFRLWCRNQWKRERYAPSFHLDDENLDPKTWCRFPILSGNYDRELEELRDFLRATAAPVARPAPASLKKP